MAGLAFIKTERWWRSTTDRQFDFKETLFVCESLSAETIYVFPTTISSDKPNIPLIYQIPSYIATEIPKNDFDVLGQASRVRFTALYKILCFDPGV